MDCKILSPLFYSSDEFGSFRIRKLELMFSAKVCFRPHYPGDDKAAYLQQFIVFSQKTRQEALEESKHTHIYNEK